MRHVRNPSARRGAVLLEAIVALAILGSAGVVIVSLAAESTRAVERARSSEREVRAADDFLANVSLWSRADLDRHLGDRHQGPWMMRVLRPRQDLYTVTLRDTATGRPMLATSLFRLDSAHAAP